MKSQLLSIADDLTVSPSKSYSELLSSLRDGIVLESFLRGYQLAREDNREEVISNGEVVK